MRIFKEENPRFQCFNCGAITKSSQWDKNIDEGNSELSTFICPICGWEHVVNKPACIPEGEKVVVRAMSVQGNKKAALEYDIYLAEEIRPLHKLKENPIRDYSDYIEDKPFFATVEEMKNTLSKENILDFIKENHSELMEYIENRGLFLYPTWIPYNELL